jgi:hypothetical protein
VGAYSRRQHRGATGRKDNSEQGSQTPNNSPKSQPKTPKISSNTETIEWPGHNDLDKTQKLEVLKMKAVNEEKVEVKQVPETQEEGNGGRGTQYRNKLQEDLTEQRDSGGISETRAPQESDNKMIR